ncbi:MAG: lipoate--protein ligase family protein [Elusimicrobia bacterium]|nr:lipoate--protein ligase family protein [Elusimicrobiota bacterium]
MPTRALLLETPALGAAAQMALDEAVLEGVEGLSLRFYRWAGPVPHAVTFGISQEYDAVLAAVRERWGGASMPLVRRATGGGIVHHDGDLTFSLTFPWPTLSDPGLVYKDIHLAAHLGFKALGVETALWSPGRTEGFRLQCFSGPEPKDLVSPAGVKALGGALRRLRGRGLYQGSLRPEVLGTGAELSRQAIVEGLSVSWKALFEPAEPSAAVSARAEELRRQRYESDRWNRRR